MLRLPLQRVRFKARAAKPPTRAESKQRAIENAEQALAKYREADRPYRLLGDNLTDHAALWSPKGQRLYSSPSIHRITGYSVTEFLALPPTALVAEADFKHIQRLLRDLEPGGPPASADYQCACKDGSVIWLESAYSLLGDGSSKPTPPDMMTG